MAAGYERSLLLMTAALSLFYTFGVRAAMTGLTLNHKCSWS